MAPPTPFRPSTLESSPAPSLPTTHRQRTRNTRPTKPARDESAAAQSLRAQFPSQLRQLRTLFPTWSDEDLLLVLGEAEGQVETAAGLIGDGFATQFASVKTHKKEPRREHIAPSGSGPSPSIDRAERPVSSAGRGGGRAGRASRPSPPASKLNGHRTAVEQSKTAAAPAPAASAPVKPAAPSWADRIKSSQTNKAAASAAASAAAAANRLRAANDVTPKPVEEAQQVPPSEDAFPPTLHTAVPSSSPVVNTTAADHKPPMSWAQVLTRPPEEKVTAADPPTETTETHEDVPPPEPEPSTQKDTSAPAEPESVSNIADEEASTSETKQEEPALSGSTPTLQAPTPDPVSEPEPVLSRQTQPAFPETDKPASPVPAHATTPIKMPTRKQAEPLVIPGGPASLDSLGLQFGSLGVDAEPASSAQVTEEPVAPGPPVPLPEPESQPPNALPENSFAAQPPALGASDRLPPTPFSQQPQLAPKPPVGPPESFPAGQAVPAAQPPASSGFEGYNPLSGYGFPPAPTSAPAAGPYGLGSAPLSQVPHPAQPIQPAGSTGQDYYNPLDGRNLSNFYGSYDPSTLALGGEKATQHTGDAALQPQASPAAPTQPAQGTPSHQATGAAPVPTQPPQFPGMVPYYYPGYYLPNNYQHYQPAPGYGQYPLYGQGQAKTFSDYNFPAGYEGFRPPVSQPPAAPTGTPTDYSKFYPSGFPPKAGSSPALQGMDPYRLDPKDSRAPPRPGQGQGFFPGYGYSPSSYNYNRGWRQP